MRSIPPFCWEVNAPALPRWLGTFILALTAASSLSAQQPVVVRPAALVQAETIPNPAAQFAPRPPANAQALTLADLEQIALQANPSIARMAALVGAARGNWWQVGLHPNPAVGYLGQQLGSGGRAEQHALLVEQEIVLGHKLKLNREAAAHEVARAEQQLAAQQQRVLTDVRIAFYEALLAQRRLELAGQLRHIAQQGQSAADRLQRAGETSRVDSIQSALEVQRAEMELNNATNRHSAAWQTLIAVVGDPQMPPAALRGDLESAPIELTWEQSLGRLLATSPEIAAAASSLERGRWVLSRARAEPIPNLRVQAAVMQDNGIDGKTDGILQVLMPLPIFNRNTGAIRQAESEVVAAERAVQQLELDLQNRLAPVFERYASAAARVRRYRENVLPIAQESLDLVRRGYEGGEFPFLNLLNAQRTYFETNLQYLESLRELRSSFAEIDGLLLRGSLSAAP
jgi:cobalt-zinc-cadmium efflux system outer membrane protein